MKISRYTFIADFSRNLNAEEAVALMQAFDSAVTAARDSALLPLLRTGIASVQSLDSAKSKE